MHDKIGYFGRKSSEVLVVVVTASKTRISGASLA